MKTMTYRPCGRRLDGCECHLPKWHTGLHQGLVDTPEGLGEVDWADGVDKLVQVAGDVDEEPMIAVMTLNQADFRPGTNWRQN